MASSATSILNLPLSFSAVAVRPGRSAQSCAGQVEKSPAAVTVTLWPRWQPGGKRLLSLGGAARRGAAVRVKLRSRRHAGRSRECRGWRTGVLGTEYGVLGTGYEVRRWFIAIRPACPLSPV